MQCPANVCRICGEKEGVSLNEYIEAGRDAAQTARNKANKSKHAPQGPGWIATYLEKELSQCDKDTPVCSPCIEEHEIKYNRKWETTKASATPLCAAGFWSCTEKKGMQEVELGNERASLLTSHGIYCVGAHIQLCGTHLRAQQRAAKKMEQQTDAVTVTAGAASGTAGTADPHSNKRSNSGSTGQSPDRKRGSEGSGDGKHNTNSTDTGNKAPTPLYVQHGAYQTRQKFSGYYSKYNTHQPALPQMKRAHVFLAHGPEFSRHPCVGAPADVPRSPWWAQTALRIDRSSRPFAFDYSLPRPLLLPSSPLFAGCQTSSPTPQTLPPPSLNSARCR